MTRLEAKLDALLDRFLGWPMPAGVGWLHTLGSAALAALAIQLVTGALMALYYCPSPELALDSVRYMARLPAGNTIRGLHQWGSSAMVTLLGLHLARVFVYAAFKGTRRWTWVTGCLLLLLVLGLGFTGYLLPWDARGYFATKVAAEIAASAPLVGPAAKQLLLGGSSLGQLTLTRFYAIHVVVLPIATLALVALHLFLVRRSGTTPPFVRDDEPVEYTGRFYPDHAWKDAAAGLALTIALLALASGWPPGPGIPAMDAPPNFVPRPEWYFLPLFELLHFFPGSSIVLGAHILPGLAFLILLALPWIERGPQRRPAGRKWPLFAGMVTAVTVVVLFLMAVFEPVPEPEKVVATPGPARPHSAPVAAAPAGKHLFLEMECATCHEAGSAPELAYIGSKVQHSWLVAFLLAPHRIRWAEGGARPIGRMPNFNLTGPEAEALAAYLMTRTDSKRFPPVPERADPRELVLRGRDLLGEKKCFDCHTLGQVGKHVGPDLTQAGARLQRPFLLGLLTRPGRTPPGNPMKVLHLAPAEIDALVAYLATLQ
ncbi:MAG: cytochrome b N-terminal domain-containing protein [Candidatus Wallbacteria bacterium]|nr:cytochrome b N-terminal domain-containing protein [Candidatus Wallbacteria bacterium]